MTDAAEKMRVEVKVMVLETLISIMRDEESENRDRLKAIELLDKMLMSDQTNVTVVNLQGLRFRRLPAWSRQHVAKVGELAAQIAHKMKARPLAE